MELSKMGLSISPSSTLAIDAKAKKMKAEGIDVIGFGAGEPDFDTPEHIKKAAIAAIEAGFTKYTPASGIMELKQAICKKFKKDNGLDYTPAQIVVSNGAKHSLINTFQAICNPGDEVIIPAPYWVSYPEMVKIAGGVPVIVKTSEQSGFKFTVDQLQQALTKKTKAIILNSPSNPTGMVYSKEELTEIADLAVERGVFVVSDEIYEKLIYDGYQHVSIASLNDKIKEQTIVVNGVSKTYAMTGWRIGYTASNNEIAKIMANIQSHATSNPNSIAQKAAEAAICGNQDMINTMVAEFISRRDYMVKRINAIPGLSCVTPKGAFYVLMNISKLIGKAIEGKQIYGSDDFADVLLEKAQVALVPGSGFGIDTHVRLSYATSLKNITEGLNRIANLLNKQQS
ncbi:pyridoxal phosphate-dependent aminotransferase [Sporomusa acidovorans]|uniref:Aminotransferase n=1 Tax=Sporomusa acidovorans (strain ATCC 49682 / DSM 3132 / Mol) TaxID=1123286 RepID=A0ABZ3IZ40_SPOA4|nr:pyridoxal phosphate-dependent aminotransferase [Sporomusa acidovorans]OZC18309.1 aspartate aminotransferase [Sporomusa acidovorans DSM 3132]SDF20406.1 aspartate aminotransferase [Sporomusa acidovorans]